MVVIQYMYKYLKRDTTDNRDQSVDFETQLQFRKTVRTNYTECGVITQLLMVAWKKWNVHVMLVAKTEGKLLECSKI